MRIRALTPLLIAALLLTSVPATAGPQSANQSGYEESYRTVRDGIGFEIYRGVLKGPERTLADGAGNSLDRALLLFSLLREAGYQPVIAYGRLQGEALRRVMERALGLAQLHGTEMEPAFIDPAAAALLESILREHYWIQIPAGDGFIDLDPSLPDTAPGTAIASFRKQIARLPSYLYQRLEVAVWDDFSIGGRRARTRLVRYIGSLQDLIGQPILLLFANRDIDNRISYSESGRFSPVLWAVGRVQPTVNLTVEANRIAAGAGGPVPPLRHHRIWIELIHKRPDTPDVTVRRLLYSEQDVEESRLDETILLTVQRESALAAYESIAGLADHATMLEGTQTPTYPAVLTATERLAATQMLAAQRDTARALTALLGRSIADLNMRLRAVCGTVPGTRSPRFTAMCVDPVRGLVRSDLMTLETNPVNTGGTPVSAPATAFALGAGASAMEGIVLAALGETPDTRDALTLTMALTDSGAGWQALDLSRLPELDGYRLDDHVLRRMEESLRAGMILILPDRRSVAARERGSLAWWQLDPQSGAVLGMIEPGLAGGEMQELGEAEWTTMAAAYAPLFTPGWPERLAEWCRRLDGLLAHGSELWVETAPADLTGRIIKLHEIVSIALAGHEMPALTGTVREFFGPAGRRYLEDRLPAVIGRPGIIAIGE